MASWAFWSWFTLYSQQDLLIPKSLSITCWEICKALRIILIQDSDELNMYTLYSIPTHAHTHKTHDTTHAHNFFKAQTQTVIKGKIFLSYILLEFCGQETDEGIVKVFTTKECVSICRLHLKHTLLDLQNGDIKCATTQIIDCNTGRRKTIPVITSQWVIN